MLRATAPVRATARVLVTLSLLGMLAGVATATAPVTAAAAVPLHARVLAVVPGHGGLAQLAADPALHVLYVTDPRHNRLWVVDTRRARTLRSVALRGTPVGVAVDASTDRVYVALRAGRLQVLAGPSGRQVAFVATAGVATAVAVDPAGRRAYVTGVPANPAKAGILTVINTRGETVLARVLVGARPFAVAVDASRHLAYVADQGSHNIAIVDTAALRLRGTVATGPSMSAVAVNPVTHDVYVASGGAVSTLLVLLGGDEGTSRLIRLVGAPAGVSLDAGHQTAFVAESDATLELIDTGGTGSVVPLTIRGTPFAVVSSPRANRVFVSDRTTGAVTVLQVRF